MKKRHYEKFRKECLTCKKTYFVSYSQRETSKYCSKKCHNDRSVYYTECKKCKKIFRRTLWQKKTYFGRKPYSGEYCSVKCYFNRKDKIFVNCDGCAKKIKIFPSQQKYYNKHYCSIKCRIKFGPIGKLTEGTIIDNNYYKFVRKVRHCSLYYEWRNKVRQKDRNRCVACGETENTTVHHKYVSMYDFIRKYGFNIDLIYRDNMFFDVNNGEILCRSCHAKCHRK